ncbi:MAG: MFS transporter [Euryarchaeota archaeon]|nr:MFS transporter [Euryarchaeota archaeon]
MKSSLKNTNFLKLWIGQIVSNIGDEVAFFGIGVLVVFAWHGTALDLSMVMVASSLPMILFGVFAGVFVDRWNKKHTMIAADVIRAFLTLLFIFCTTVLQLAVVVFFISTVSRFFYPSRVAIIPEILGEEHLVEANSLSQMTYMLSVILGPVIATSMIYLLGYFWIFVFDAASYIFSAVMLSLMHYTSRHRESERKNPLHELKDGLAYIMKNRTVKYLILVFSFVMLFVGGLNVIFSIYVRDVVHMGIEGYGAIEVLFGVGTIVGSVLTGIIAGHMLEGRMLLLGIFVMGVIIMSIGFFPVAWAAIILGGFIIGVSVAFINAPSTAVFQRVISEEYRGRVFGAQGAVIQGVTLISIVIMGILVEIFGVLPVIIASGIILTIFAGILILYKPVVILLSGENLPE